MNSVRTLSHYIQQDVMHSAIALTITKVHRPQSSDIDDQQIRPTMRRVRVCTYIGLATFYEQVCFGTLSSMRRIYKTLACLGLWLLAFYRRAAAGALLWYLVCAGQSVACGAADLISASPHFSYSLI